MSVRRNLALALSVAGLTSTALLAGSGPAFAGTNGQQIDYVDNTHLVNSVLITGHTQAGLNGPVISQCFQTPSYQNFISGWYWEGWVTADAYTSSDCGKSSGAGRYTTNELNVAVTSRNDYWAIANSYPGSNNQQLEFFDNAWSTSSIGVSGYNQYGNHIDNACFPTNSWDNQISNWWWNGTVEIRQYSSLGCPSNAQIGDLFTLTGGPNGGSWHGAVDS